MLADSDTTSAPSTEIQNFTYANLTIGTFTNVLYTSVYLILIVFSFSIRLFVSSWNVGGIAPPNDLNMEDLLDTQNNLADIYVLG